ncbi:ATP-binding protein [Nocardia stercoris]|uniref:ATP-binding protein n=1 Tax=Nocardia stercoris TaxID=2483361 RepID=A0A3M2L5U7_9NOCA|nr:ATP-binding protein [Nocardia stercoris]RMI32937.1 ATP-binding protein [Nocardia stercoris]
MSDFVGRKTELTMLESRLERIESSGSGIAVAVRGRRQVGKSRLVQEFCDRAAVPYVYSTATKGASPTESIGWLLRDIRESTLPGASENTVVQAASWLDALRVLNTALPQTPSIVVLDEVPWLAEQDGTFDGALQAAWDRLLSRKPVLLLLLGSDLHMMERLTSYDRPFFGRADNLVLGPLNPADIASATGLAAAEALDAHLITGGLPGILRSWPRGREPLEFLRDQCSDPAAPVFSIPESTLLAEFPGPDQSRRVLEAVGGGDRTHATIAAAAGGREGPLASGSLSPLLRRLTTEKRILALDEPLSTRPGRPALYHVADSNLRLHLSITRAAQDFARRGRPDMAFRLVERRWSGWRGRAIEPLVREALELSALSGRLPWGEVERVGGWWNRQFNPEIDLVGADRGPVANQVFFAGSVKWLGTAFDDHDLTELQRAAVQIPGFDPGTTGLVAVSRSGVTDSVAAAGIGLIWGATDIVGAWQT